MCDHLQKYKEDPRGYIATQGEVQNVTKYILGFNPAKVR